MSRYKKFFTDVKECKAQAAALLQQTTNQEAISFEAGVSGAPLIETVFAVDVAAGAGSLERRPLLNVLRAKARRIRNVLTLLA
jgi:hypothetical protein